MKHFTFLLIFILSTQTVLAQGITSVTSEIDPEQSLENEEVIDFESLKPLKEPFIRPQLDPSKIKIHIKESSRNTPTLRSIDAGSIMSGVDLGWTWLQNNQNEDGSWSKSGNTKERDTQAAIEFMSWIEDESSDSWVNALTWYQLKMDYNSDSLSRKIFNLALGEDYTDDLSSYLVTQVNSITRGFGYNKYHQQDVLTTALALKALTESGYFGEDGTDLTVYDTLYELLIAQNADGGYGYIPGGDSKLYPTEIALDALLPYDQLTFEAEGSSGPILIEIATVLDAGFEFLKYEQNEDGSFGESFDQSALAYDLLLRRNDYPADNEAALNYLLSEQGTDGSYNDSNPYSTALAIKALAKPDLSMDEPSIDTQAPLTDATITVPITNQGYLDAQPFTLEIDLNDEAFASFDLPYTMEANSTLNVEVGFTGGFPIGSYDFVFRVVPSEEVGELDPDNNSQAFSVDFSNYIGPTPPAWFGAATSFSAGRVTLSWLPSEDSALSYYKIYIGSTSGSYFYESSALSASTIGASISGLTADKTYYFNILAYDSSGNRGDFATESSAVAKTTPSQSASMHGSVSSNGSPLSNASLSIHYFGDTLSADQNGEFAFNIYPGTYYFTASASGYEDQGQGVILPDGLDTEVNFELEALDDGISPSAVTGLSATEGNREIILTWTPGTETNFEYYNVYRSSFPITSLSALTPLTQITEQSTNTTTDSTIQNGINYYYTLTVVDSFENESTTFETVGPLVGNSAPVLTNLTATQEDAYVRITYTLADEENEKLDLVLEYWDGSTWMEANQVSGVGVQSTGTAKTMLWNAKADFPNQDIESAQVRITADDGQTVNATSTLTSSTFSLDTLGPILTINPLESSSANPTLTGSSDEELNSLSLLVNGTSYEASLNGLEFTVDITESLADGYYEVSATGTDLYGNSAQDESTYELLVDASAPTSVSFYSGNGDGSILGAANKLWTVIHNASVGGTASSSAANFFIRTGKDSTGKYLIERGFLPFNTSSLPDNAEILSANLQVYINSKSDRDNDGDDFITLVNTSQSSTLSLSTDDYDQAGAVTNPSEGSDRKDITTITTGGYLSFTLNATGLSWISTNGSTKLGLREGHDVLNSAFTGAANQSNSIQIRSANTAGTTSDPLLQVSYELPIEDHYDAEGNLVE